VTVFILPCGTSVLDNLRSGGRGSVKCFEEVRSMTRWADQQRLAEGSTARWAHAVGDEIGRLLPAVQSQISAERASLWQCPGGPPGPEDTVVFLASDSHLGVLAALVNALLLDGTAKYHSGPPGDAGVETRGIGAGGAGPTSHVVRIAGLVPDNTETFAAAMKGTALALRWAAGLDGTRVLHLTGGFKATIPYLVVLAEYLRASCGQVRAFCLHAGEGAHRPPPVEIFLRRVDAREDAKELSAAELGRLSPTDGRLRGFAYERQNDGTERFTSLGDAIRTLLQ